MQEFSVYLRLGVNHILDWQGYDHLLFIAAMTWVYRLRHFSRILWLITAFTVGHSVTLAMSVLGQVNLSMALIEAIIPCTLIATCFSNLFYKAPKIGEPQLGHAYFRYGLVFIFGLIHGLGFSNYLKALLIPSTELWKPLLAFNLGIEVAQIILVAVVLGLNTLSQDIFNIKRKDWVLGGSMLIAGLSISLLIGKASLFFEGV